MKLENHPVQEQVLLVESYVWALVVLIVTVILAGIVFFMLYSVTFVTQPIKSMAPIDQGYLKMLNDIVLCTLTTSQSSHTWMSSISQTRTEKYSGQFARCTTGLVMKR